MIQLTGKYGDRIRIPGTKEDVILLGPGALYGVTAPKGVGLREALLSVGLHPRPAVEGDYPLHGADYIPPWFPAPVDHQVPVVGVMNLLECELDTIHCPGAQQTGCEEEVYMDW